MSDNKSARKPPSTLTESFGRFKAPDRWHIVAWRANAIVLCRIESGLLVSSPIRQQSSGSRAPKHRHTVGRQAHYRGVTRYWFGRRRQPHRRNRHNCYSRDRRPPSPYPQLLTIPLLERAKEFELSPPTSAYAKLPSLPIV